MHSPRCSTPVPAEHTPYAPAFVLHHQRVGCAGLLIAALVNPRVIPAQPSPHITRPSASPAAIDASISTSLLICSLITASGRVAWADMSFSEGEQPHAAFARVRDQAAPVPHLARRTVHNRFPDVDGAGSVPAVAPTSSCGGSSSGGGGGTGSSGAAGHSGAATPGALLISKVLTYSDVSTEVARTGRIVLPRIQVRCAAPLRMRCQLGGGGLCGHGAPSSRGCCLLPPLAAAASWCQL